jgi:hypothetical protein
MFSSTRRNDELYRHTAEDLLLKCLGPSQARVAMGEVYEGCEECQRFGGIQLVPTAMLHPIVKPWPFRG